MTKNTRIPRTGRAAEPDVNPVVHGCDAHAECQLTRCEAEESHRNDAEHDPDHRDGGGTHRAVQEGLLVHQPERDKKPDKPVGDEPVDQQRGDAPTEPGNRAGAGFGQTKALTGIFVGS